MSLVSRFTFVLALLAIVGLSTNAFADVAVIGGSNVEFASRTDNFAANLPPNELSLTLFNNFGGSPSFVPFVDFSRSVSGNLRKNGDAETLEVFSTGGKFGEIIQLYRSERDSPTPETLFRKKPHKHAAAVPEPMSLLLLGSVLMPLGWWKCRP
jgi:hypothetical protein